MPVLPVLVCPIIHVYAYQRKTAPAQDISAKIRDRSGARIKFTSALLPPYLRRAQSVEEVLPWLYLKGISTGDMQEALEALLGPEAKGLSPASISRLKARWEDEHQSWSGRDLSDMSRAERNCTVGAE